MDGGGGECICSTTSYNGRNDVCLPTNGKRLRTHNIIIYKIKWPSPCPRATLRPTERRHHPVRGPPCTPGRRSTSAARDGWRWVCARARTHIYISYMTEAGWDAGAKVTCPWIYDRYQHKNAHTRASLKLRRRRRRRRRRRPCHTTVAQTFRRAGHDKSGVRSEPGSRDCRRRDENRRRRRRVRAPHCVYARSRRNNCILASCRSRAIIMKRNLPRSRR